MPIPSRPSVPSVLSHVRCWRRRRVWPSLVSLAFVTSQVVLIAGEATVAEAAPVVKVRVGAVANPAQSSAPAMAWSSAPQRGVDVASHQHPGGAPIDWSAVAAWGMDYAYIKATEGPSDAADDTYINPYFGEDWRGAGAAGLLRGAYHFARPRLPLWTATYDAQAFLLTTGPFTGVNDLPPVLDLEDSGGLSR